MSCGRGRMQWHEMRHGLWGHTARPAYSCSDTGADVATVTERIRPRRGRPVQGCTARCVRVTGGCCSRSNRGERARERETGNRPPFRPGEVGVEGERGEEEDEEEEGEEVGTSNSTCKTRPRQGRDRDRTDTIRPEARSNPTTSSKLKKGCRVVVCTKAAWQKREKNILCRGSESGKCCCGP